MLVVTLLFTSCFKEPNYSNVPTLKYQKHDVTNSTFDVNNPQESYIYVEYTDGDADLGLLQIDTVIGGRDTTIARAGKLYYNFPKYGNIAIYNSFTFPEIAEVSGLLPKTGVLRLKMSGLLDASFPGFSPVSEKTVDTLSLKIWITDIAGNVSNTITTPEFIIKIR